MGFQLVLTSLTLNVVMTTNVCFVVAELVHVMRKKVRLLICLREWPR